MLLLAYVILYLFFVDRPSGQPQNLKTEETVFSYSIREIIL